MRRTALATLLALGCGTAFASGTPGQTLLVLDMSGSMWGQINGEAKVGIAREALGAMLSDWNGGDLGLIAYGHNRKGDCNDIELLAAPGELDPPRLIKQAQSILPKGMTPITAAVRQAAEALRHVEQKATVILISDGEETCGGDPCALGAELEASGVDFTAHVIGFDVESNPLAREQLQCLASSTGGRYLAARDAAELGQALETVASTEPPAVAEPEPAGIRARPGQEWIEGYALHPETGVTLDPDGASPQDPEFGPEQTAAECQALCMKDEACAGWHYEPAGSYFVGYARCYFKGHRFAVRLHREGEGWVAGIRPGVDLVVDEEDAD